MHDLTGLSAVDLSAAIARGDVSCVEVMQAFLDRIDALNPKLNAIVALRPREELLAEARAADNAPRKGWLHGLPFAIKDLADTAGIVTARGSPIYAGHVPAQDSLLAERVRAAGAIVIGKTNTPEFGMGSHTYNPVYGTTLNPYDTTKSAGGSSGGAGAALAARLLPVADGSDMMGSLRNPAAYNNVYGFRPSYGRVPADNVGDVYLHELATDGPMGRSVRDVAMLLDTLAGPDPRQPHCLPKEPSFAGRLDADVRGRRIGWLGDWDGFFAIEPDMLALCEGALDAFADLGCRVEPVVPEFDPKAVWDAWLTLRHWAISALRQVEYADPHKRALLKPEAIWEIEGGLKLSALDVHRASVIRSDWLRCVTGLFDRYDALVLPSAQLFPFDAAITWPARVANRAMTTYHQWMAVVVPVSLLGLPALGMPAGFGPGGLPGGIQLFGRPGADAAILQLGHAYHQATHWPARRPPDQ
ncbi:MAG: amidase [Rhodobiaceae bacterium]|nr:amidase [Rhodobiaceae bacterium]